MLPDVVFLVNKDVKKAALLSNLFLQPPLLAPRPPAPRSASAPSFLPHPLTAPLHPIFGSLHSVIRSAHMLWPVVFKCLGSSIPLLNFSVPRSLSRVGQLAHYYILLSKLTEEAFLCQ